MLDIPRPYLGTSLERLAALINSDNDVSLVPGKDYTLTGPLSFQGSAGENTKIYLTPTNPPNQTPIRLTYTRLDLAILGNQPSGYIKSVVVPGFPFFIHDVLPSINTAFGLSLTPDEVENTQFDSDSSVYTLTIREDVSYAWIGSYDFEVRLVGTPTPLRELILKHKLKLSALTYIPPTE